MNPRLLDLLFLLPIVTVTFAALRFATVVVDLSCSDILISVFLVAFVVDRLLRRDTGIHPQAAAIGMFMLVFLAVYLFGYFNLQSKLALTFWSKGVFAWLAHALFLVFGVAHIARRGPELYWRTVRWFVGGIALCAAYGVVQLTLKVATGINLEEIVVGTLTFGTGKITGINIYGQVGGTENIYRVNALTGDPNHLGVILCVPLLMLLPLFLADPRGRRRLGFLLAFLLAVQVLTLSRSAALGDVVGLLVLLPFIRPILPSMRAIGVAVGSVAAAFVALYVASPFVQTVVESRTQTGGRSTQIHLEFYELIPPALGPNPLFGMGFNTFADFYEFVTGQSDFGPHSFWVATLVETGVVGLTVYLAYFAYLVLSAMLVGRSSDPDASRLGAGLTAALVGTAAANFFYLTMQFAYFFVIAIVILGAVVLYAPARAPVRQGRERAAGTLAR